MLRPAAMLALVAALALGVSSCDVETTFRETVTALFYDTEPKPKPRDTAYIAAQAETEPVLDASDAADDPAIWIDAEDPRRSWVIGTNKRRGIEVYDMRGRRAFRLDAGRINNGDLRSGVPVSGTTRIVVGATNRSTVTIEVWALDPASGALSNLLAEPLPAAVNDPYGFCLYLDSERVLYAIATAKEGGAVQWRLDDTGQGTLRGVQVRRIPTATQAEGCVADDANGTLFIGEEDVGIWRLDADPSAGERELIATVRPDAEADAPLPTSPHRLTADVEGLAIYAPPNADPSSGYLLASSQGNSTIVVFDRAPPHAYRSTFHVADGIVDGASDTDGLEVTALAAGPAYPRGLLVVQDGQNTEPMRVAESPVPVAGEANQNFKYVSWADVETALDLNLGA